MLASSSIELFPFASARVAPRLGLALKPSVILIRWPVVIICTYLLLYPSVNHVPALVSYGLVLLYIASNVALYLVSEDRFLSWAFYYPLVIADTIVLTMSLVINGYSETEFYLTFFVVILGSCIVEDAKMRVFISIAAPITYSLTLLTASNSLHPVMFLRLPFLFIVSLFYGYFTQFIRTERALRREEELRNRGRKEILNVVSHEFRTPLNVISGYAQALKEDTFGALNTEQSVALDKILTQSDNLMDIVSAILDMTRIDTGELITQNEPVALTQFLNEVALKIDTRDKTSTLQWDIPAALPEIVTDRVKLAVIIQNLVHNALKFTDNGWVRVTARTSADPDRFKVEVKDNGIGIPRDAQNLIFERFQQGDSTSTRNYGGIGLGLYIVKVFTDLLGGRVDVYSEPGKGATFILTLPIAR